MWSFMEALSRKKHIEHIKEGITLHDIDNISDLVIDKYYNSAKIKATNKYVQPTIKQFT